MAVLLAAGVPLFACGADGSRLVGNGLSPLFTFQIPLNTPATGVAQANGKGLKRYYESPHKEAYCAYRASTSILVPMVGYRHVRLWLKRSLFLDLERYEYRPRENKELNSFGDDKSKRSVLS